MYGKFFASTFTGSMFGAGADVFAVWGYVIANTVNATVELNPDMLAAILGMTPERVTMAIDFLCSPDNRSRNHDESGRRLIQQGPFQFHVVSHQHYRAIRNEDDRREYNRRKQAESRARRQEVSNVSNQMSLTVNDMSTMSAHTEAEAEAEKNTSPKSAQIETLYQLYPRHVGKEAAKKAIDKALRKVPFDDLLLAVRAYVRFVAIKGIERQFIPHPASWFNAGRYQDDELREVKSQKTWVLGDWRDPEAWKAAEIPESEDL